MSKRLSPVEQMQLDTRKQLLTIITPCDSKKHPLHFAPGSGVMAIVKQIGITYPTLMKFVRGGTISTRSTGKIQDFLAKSAVATETE